jgi:S1-C subfamily serine protease
MTPRFVRLTATFPDQLPVNVDPSKIRLSFDEVDVAVMTVEVDTVPVLPLHTGDVEELRGRRVVLLGYPTGLNAVLARTEQSVVEEVMSVATDTPSLIAELASRGLISPVITQGALNEVRERRLVYDAETTSGGSGGPVFGPDGTVIGVNFAITREFDGSNFGVPIEFVRRLLAGVDTE